MTKKRWLIPVVVSICTSLATAVSAQTNIIPMRPGYSYDPEACDSVTLTSGLYVCSPPTIHGVSYCAHDATIWHALVERNTDNSIRCTYGHEHGENPAAFDGTFGPLPAVVATQTISYPWATANENSTTEPYPNKHRAYAWEGSNNVGCPTTGALAVTAFRTEMHMDGSLNLVSRYHSYWSQYRVQTCGDPNSVGYVYFGGHID